MGDRRHGRVHIAAGTCALLQSRIDCWYTTAAWVPKRRVGRPAARPGVFVVLVGVGCQVQTVLRLCLVAKVDLHGSPRCVALCCFLGPSACHESLGMNRDRANTNSRPWI